MAKIGGEAPDRVPGGKCVVTALSASHAGRAWRAVLSVAIAGVVMTTAEAAGNNSKPRPKGKTATPDVSTYSLVGFSAAGTDKPVKPIGLAVGTVGAIAVAHAQKNQPGRTLEEIQYTFDKNKASIYATFNDALKRKPGLQGKMVVSVTIEPSGKVSKVSLVSSEVEDEDLVLAVVRKIEKFEFGARNVPSFTYPSYPIHFFPS